MRKIAMLGSGFISDFYCSAIQGQRSKDKVIIAASRSEDKVKDFAERNHIPEWTTSLDEAINHPEVEIVCVGLPNFLHKEVILKAAKAGKGAAQLDGRMIDAASARMAENVVNIDKLINKNK